MHPATSRLRTAAPSSIGLAALLVVAGASSGFGDSTGVERLGPPPGTDAEPMHSGSPASSGTIQGFRLEVQAGVLRWKWNEVVPYYPQLEELGFVPVAKVEGTWVDGALRLGASLELLSGAITYDGYLQSRSEFSLTPYESNTHYLAATPEVSLQWRGTGPMGWLRPSLALSRPWWRRTIDGTRDRVHGPFGYVETWSVLTVAPGLEVGRPLGASGEFALSAEVPIPLSTAETIGSGSQAIELQPKTRPGIRLAARGVYQGRYLAELEVRAVRFEESDPVAREEKGVSYLIFQPESSLETISWRFGRIF